MHRTSKAVWKGTLKEGQGTLETQSGALADLPYSFKGRFQDESGQSGTNPEELIAAAHAGCFAMQLSHLLAENGTPAEALDVSARVEFGPAAGGGFAITASVLTLAGKVAGIDAATFEDLADKAKASCPVSGALSAIDIRLEARLA